MSDDSEDTQPKSRIFGDEGGEIHCEEGWSLLDSTTRDHTEHRQRFHYHIGRPSDSCSEDRKSSVSLLLLL
jgi:hypothetical protein